MAGQFDLNGDIALVTGASGGLGSRFAKTLALQGAQVVLAARRMGALEALREDIETLGGQAFSVSMSKVAVADVLQQAVGTASFAALKATARIWYWNGFTATHARRGLSMVRVKSL